MCDALVVAIAPAMATVPLGFMYSPYRIHLLEEQLRDIELQSDERRKEEGECSCVI